MSTEICKLIETFKEPMIKNLTPRFSNPEAIVEAAVNRLIGQPIVSSGEPDQEQLIYSVIAKTLASVPNVNFQLPADLAQEIQRPPAPQYPASWNSSQYSSSSSKTIPTQQSCLSAKPTPDAQVDDSTSATQPVLKANDSIKAAPDTSMQKYTPTVLDKPQNAAVPMASPSNFGTERALGSPAISGEAGFTAIMPTPTTNENMSGSLAVSATTVQDQKSFDVANVTTASTLAPVPTGHDNGAKPESTPPLAAVQRNASEGQIAGQKRPHDDSLKADLPHTKRVATGAASAN